jgi:hypothetical protein
LGAHLLECACAPAEIAKRPAAQGAGEGNTATRHPRGGAVLRRREEHPALTEGLQRFRDPGPASAQGAPGIPRMRLVLSKSTCGPQVRLGKMAGAPYFKYADARCTWYSKGAPGISMCTCNVHGRTGRYRGAPAVHRCTLGMAGAPCFK